MEKKLFYLSDSETNKTILIEAVKEKGQGQWKALCAKCKGSSQTTTINDKLNIFHCYKCGWKGDLNHSARPKQATTNSGEEIALLFNPENTNQSSGAIKPQILTDPLLF